MVAMESTGSYWKPLYNILEMNDLPVMVVNAAHMKAVPGRKTDVSDAEWIADLTAHGLLRASYIPDKAQRELRELVRYRKSLVEDKARELNRLQKMLEGANIKLSGTLSNINGMSARSILNYTQRRQTLPPILCPVKAAWLYIGKLYRFRVYLVTGKKFDEATFDEMRQQGRISNHLKAPKSQILDDLNGVLTPLQRLLS